MRNTLLATVAALTLLPGASFACDITIGLVLELTGEADAGLDALRQGFLQFEESVRAMQAGQSSQSLTIAAPRDFTAKWLHRRLADHAGSEPGLQFLLVAADEAEDMNSDLAITVADGRFMKPLDIDLIRELVKDNGILITVVCKDS